MNAPPTRKQRIVTALEAYGPLKLADLHEMMPDIPENSLSVALSQLRVKRKVDKCEKGWFAMGEEREQPAGETQEHSDTPTEGEALPPPDEPAAGRIVAERTTTFYRVGDEHPAPTVEQVREVLNRMPKGAPQLPGLKLNPVDLTGGRYPGPNPAPTAPAYTFHVKTKSLQVSITGDDADSIAAIRAVAEALEDQARKRPA